MEQSWSWFLSYKQAGEKYVLSGGAASIDLPGGLRFSGLEDFFGNLGLEGHAAIRLIVPSGPEITLLSFSLEFPYAYEPEDRIFVNGFQSWTESREFRTDERLPRLRMPMQRLLNTTGDYTFLPYSGKKGHFHSFTFSYRLRENGESEVWADRRPDSGYTIFQHNVPENKLRVEKHCAGETVVTETVLLDLHLAIGELEDAANEALSFLSPRPAKAPVFGWTSWYNHYTKITEAIILENLMAFYWEGIPLDLFQIDDGWQPAIGDWTEANEKFPGGMKMLAGSIHAKKFKAGLWLAPFIVEKKSTVYRDHQDWLLTHDGEHLVAAGYNPGWGGVLSGTYYVLDIGLPEVRAHLREVFDVVLNKWGYDLVKLDFLFAAGLIPRQGKSRGQWMAEGMRLLRECCGDKLILGCGVPLGPAMGLVEYCRIGPDIGLGWDMASAKMIHLRERISTRNALGNAMGRRFFSGTAFWNDPDVFILREENNKLKPAQRHTLFLLNLLFGDLVLTSDDPRNYDEATYDLLWSAFPLCKARIRRARREEDVLCVECEMEGLRYMIYSNLGRREQAVELPEGVWYEAGKAWSKGGGTRKLQSWETRCFLYCNTARPGVVGGMHLFPGMEVKRFTPSGEGFELEIDPRVEMVGVCFVHVRGAAEMVQINGLSYAVTEHAGMRIARFPYTPGGLR